MTIDTPNFGQRETHCHECRYFKLEELVQLSSFLVGYNEHIKAEIEDLPVICGYGIGDYQEGHYNVWLAYFTNRLIIEIEARKLTILESCPFFSPIECASEVLVKEMHTGGIDTYQY